MIQMGDKSMALKAAMEAGVPVVPGSHGLVNDIQQARKVADRIGYPLLLKEAVFGVGVKVCTPGQEPRTWQKPSVG